MHCISPFCYCYQRLSGLHTFELAVVELGVEAACSQQLVVIALLHDVAVLHHKDDVCLSDGGKAVGYDEAGAALHHAGKGFLDAHLGAGIINPSDISLSYLS